MKVVEIFDSFQGEGLFTGVPATFLRLADCNLSCDFCDTDFNYYKEMSVELTKEAIINHMKNHNNDLLVITGGEPLLQINEINELKKDLHCAIQIETNGIMLRDIDPNIIYVVSPKIKVKEIFDRLYKYPNVFFKFLIKNKYDLDMVEYLQEIYDYDNYIWLQPEFSRDKEITKEILNSRMGNIIISGQLHKYLGAD